MSTSQANTQTLTASPAPRPREPAYVASPANAIQVPWTATRCQRLLRPLSSKIALLRKLKKGKSDEYTTASYNDGGLELPPQAYLTSRAQCKEKESSQEHHAEWDHSQRPGKRIRRTYSGRGRNCMEPGSQLSENEARSTIQNSRLQCTKGPRVDSFQTGSSFCQTDSSSSPIEDMSDLSQTVFGHDSGRFGQRVRDIGRNRRNESKSWSGSTECGKLCRGVNDSLLAVLIATDDAIIKKSSGCRSLFSMCLRRVPNYIDEEQRLALEEDPDHDEDISFQVYSELESTAVSDSWKPLRIVVRSHAVNIIGKAIMDGVLSQDSALSLLDLCLEHGADDEAQTLLEQMIEISLKCGELSVKLDGAQRHRIHILEGLTSFWHQTGRQRAVYRQVTRLIEAGLRWTVFEKLILPHWMQFSSDIDIGDNLCESTEMVRAIVRQTYGSASYPSSSLVEDLRRCGHLKQKRVTLRKRLAKSDEQYSNAQIQRFTENLNQHTCIDQSRGNATFNRLLSKIVTLVSFQNRLQRDCQEGNNASLCLLLEEVALEGNQFLDLQELTHGYSKLQTSQQGIATVILTYDLFILGSEWQICEGKDQSLPSIDRMRDLTLTEDETMELGRLFLEIIDSRSKTSPNDYQFVRKEVSASWTRVKTSGSCKDTRVLLGRILVAAAFAFAERTGQPSNLEWALELEEEICGKLEDSPSRPLFRTPAKALNHAKRAYRWEEGICEWIAKSPGISLAEKGAPASMPDQKLRRCEEKGSPGLRSSQRTSATNSSPDCSPCKAASPKENEKTPSLKCERSFLKCIRISIDSAGGSRPPGNKLQKSTPSEISRACDEADELCTTKHFTKPSLPVAVSNARRPPRDAAMQYSINGSTAKLAISELGRNHDEHTSLLELIDPKDDDVAGDDELSFS